MDKNIRNTIILVILILILFIPNDYGHAMQTNLKVILNSNFPPYQFINDKGEIVGMHIEILDAIAKYNNFKIEYIPVQTDKECLEAINKGEVDLVLGVLINKNSEYYPQFTSEISSSTLCMIAPNEFAKQLELGENISNHYVAYEYGTASYPLISNLRASRYLALGNQKEVFENQLSGISNSMVGAKNSILYQIDEMGMYNDYTIVHNYLSTIRYAILTQEGDKELMRYLNDGIALLHANSEYEKIYNEWTIDEGSKIISVIIKKVVSISAIIILLSFLYIAFVSYMKSILKKQVSEKTKEIQKANQELEYRMRQIQYESKLRNSIIEYSPTAMILFDKDYSITLANSGAGNLVGAANNLIQENILKLNVFGNILKDKKDEIFREDYSLNNHIFSMETEVGVNKSYRYNIHQTVELGEVNGILLTVEDVTKEEIEKQKMFEEEKNKALNRIVAGIAHEIRNPLMSIRTFATLINTKGNSQEFQDAFAKFVPNEVDRINGLIESLINYAKPVTKDMEPVNIKYAIEDCMYLIHMAIIKVKIQVDIDIEDHLVIYANKNQIKQVLINIFMNSIESMEKKIMEYEIEEDRKLIMNISAWQENNEIKILIRDEGVGMSKNVLKNCMEPFFTTKSSGTGLGLSLLEVFIKENNGKLYIHSTEHEYTEIIIKFRRYQDETKSINN